MKIKNLDRVFNYNGQAIPDPNPSLSDAAALKVLAAQFPELVNAKLDPEEISGDKRILPIHTSVGTKG